VKKIALIGCGAYMDSGYGCPGEWRCLKAAALGEHSFDKPSQVVAFLKCKCPGRTIVPNLNMAMKLSETRPDVIHLSTCLATANPGCPYGDTEQFASILENKTGLKVILGTHDYH